MKAFLRLFESKKFPRSTKIGKFDKLFRKLPPRIQKSANDIYAQWRRDPASVDFRPLANDKTTWRISLADGYRVLGKDKGDTIQWFWIGSHNDYERFT